MAFGITGMQGYTVLSTETINYGGQYNWTYYKLDIVKYLQNLQTSTSLDQLKTAWTSVDYGLAMPIKPTGIDVVKWLAYIVNWLIAVINMITRFIGTIILFPTKLILYPINVLLAIFGINTSDQAFISVFNKLYSIDIPIIQYI